MNNTTEQGSGSAGTRPRKPRGPRSTGRPELFTIGIMSGKMSPTLTIRNEEVESDKKEQRK